MTTDQTCASVSKEDFVRNLKDSGLSAVGDLVPDHAAADGLALAREMVTAGHLTAFQADAVLERRFAELLIGNYEILDRLGVGGMGAVYKARHRRMKRVVALKVLSREVAGKPAFAQRFQREVETISRLTHPNIVMAFDADEAESGPFLVMEFVNGRDLASDVEKNGSFSIADAVDCTLQAARGLAYAHSQGIIHRDIKPANLIRDISGVIKVADLGLARLNTPDVNTSITQAGGVLGTMDYMPPEQALDSTAIDHRADVYSLGCTLYFLIAGHPPYAGGSIMALLLKHRDAPIPPLHADRSDVPPELDAIYRRMVAKKLDDRFATMADAVQELENLAARLRFNTERPSGPISHTGGAVAAGTTTEFLPAEDRSGGSTVVLPSPVQTPLAASEIAGLTVVLVETSRTQAGIIRRYLSEFGVSAIHQTGAGGEALAIAKKEQAAVILCSMHLSDMTGVQLAQLVLTDPECSKIGVVLATSATDAEHIVGLPSSHRFVVMPKPFDAKQLARSVVSVVSHPATH